MQAFHAEGRLAFAGAEAKRRREDRIHVGVLDHQRAAGEVGVEVELEAPREAPAQVRTQPPEREGVDDLVVDIVSGEAAIGMDEQPDLQTEISVRRLNDEPVLPGGDTGGGRPFDACGLPARRVLGQNPLGRTDDEQNE